MTRKVLLVFAHPDATSYSAALRDLVMRVATERGAEIRLHDLYECGFSPVVSANEWTLRGAAPDTSPTSCLISTMSRGATRWCSSTPRGGRASRLC